MFSVQGQIRITLGQAQLLPDEMSGILGIAFGGETCTKAVGLGPIITGAYEDAPTQ